jgi:hypothetical protein
MPQCIAAPAQHAVQQYAQRDTLWLKLVDGGHDPMRKPLNGWLAGRMVLPCRRLTHPAVPCCVVLCCAVLCCAVLSCAELWLNTHHFFVGTVLETRAQLMELNCAAYQQVDVYKVPSFLDLKCNVTPPDPDYGYGYGYGGGGGGGSQDGGSNSSSGGGSTAAIVGGVVGGVLGAVGARGVFLQLYRYCSHLYSSCTAGCAAGLAVAGA